MHTQASSAGTGLQIVYASVTVQQNASACARGQATCGTMLCCMPGVYDMLFVVVTDDCCAARCRLTLRSLLVLLNVYLKNFV